MLIGALIMVESHMALDDANHSLVLKVIVYHKFCFPIGVCLVTLEVDTD